MSGAPNPADGHDHANAGSEGELTPLELAKLKLEIWKTTVDVQQHFNDLELRIRNYAVTVLTAVLGAAGVAIKERLFVRFEGFNTTLAVWFLGVGLVAWLAFYFMDRWWYHRLLYGAVSHGLALEKELAFLFPGRGLTGMIGDASPMYVAGWKIRSPWKIDAFYGGVGFLLLIGAIVLHTSLRP